MKIAMDDHKVPLTPIEEEGLRAHGLNIGTPSQLSDAFRQGVKWAIEEKEQKPVASCPRCEYHTKEHEVVYALMNMSLSDLQDKYDLLVIERDSQTVLIADQQADVETQTEIANNFAEQVRQKNEEISELQARVIAQDSEVDRLKKEVEHRQSLLRESNRNCAEHAGVVWTQNVTIAQQTRRIAEQLLLINTCADDLLAAKQMLERHGETPYFLQDRLAAIVEHKQS